MTLFWPRKTPFYNFYKFEKKNSLWFKFSKYQGSTRQDEFIITQYPTEETKCCFWQMVWDNNSSQIVVLNADDTENCKIYWLPLGEYMECDSFTVMLREENFDINFVVRDFLLQSLDEDYEFNCRMISACYWPDSCAPIRTSFDLINKVKSFRVQSSTLQNSLPPPSIQSIQHGSGSSTMAIGGLASPLIVHDLYGGFRAATFCALYTFQDLIQLESSVNVYELAKMFHLKRPNIWSSRANISFLYEAVDSLFEEMHMNHQYQFKNYLNLNIDNHFSNYYSNNFQNVSTKATSTSTTTSTAASNNHTSLNLLPTTQNSQSATSTTATVTLPNNLTTNKNQKQFVNDPIGSRLYNFQNNIVQQRAVQSGNFSDPSTTVPLQEASKIPKTSLLPSFFHQNQSEKRTSNRNSKATKFMNTMRIKSASFKRALFPNYNSGHHQAKAQPEIYTPSMDIVANSNEQQPSIIIALSSTSSSATTSSSSTSAMPLSHPPIIDSVTTTTTTTNPGNGENLGAEFSSLKTNSLMQSVPVSLNNSSNKVNSLSREKLAL